MLAGSLECVYNSHFFYFVASVSWPFALARYPVPTVNCQRSFDLCFILKYYLHLSFHGVRSRVVLYGSRHCMCHALTCPYFSLEFVIASFLWC